jgi:lipoprotein signal peptidase
VFRGSSNARIKVIAFLLAAVIFSASYVFEYVLDVTGVRNCGFFFVRVLPLSVFLFFSAITIIFVFYILVRSTDSFETILWGTILGGGVYNTFQRFSTNCVLDYLDFYFFKSNIADLAISLGVLTLLCKLCIKPLMPAIPDGEGKDFTDF